MIKDEAKRDEIIFAQVEGDRPPREDRQPSRPPQPQPRLPAPKPEPKPEPQPQPQSMDPLSLEEDAIEALEALDPHWRKDPGDFERRERMTRAEVRVERALQFLSQDKRILLWGRYGEGAAAPAVVYGATPQLDMDSVPF